MKIIHDPKLKIISFLDERFYTRDNEKFFPGATTILDLYPKGYGFAEYLKREGYNTEEILRRAQEQGTKIHKAIERMVQEKEKLTWINKEGAANFSPDEWQMLHRFKEFWEREKPEIIAAELSMLNETLGYGGTIDLVCKLRGQIWLIDYKSSNQLHKTHELQIASYRRLWDEAYPKQKIERYGILHLKASTRGPNDKLIQGVGWKMWDPEEKRDWDKAYKVFEYTKNIWYEENPNYKPKNLILPDNLKL